MATTTVKTQTPALITGSLASFYTVSAGSVVGNVKEILLCNTTTTGTDYNVIGYYVPSGQSASTSFMFMSSTTISSGTTVRIPMNSFLATGTQVQFVASSANKIMCVISAVEYS